MKATMERAPATAQVKENQMNNLTAKEKMGVKKTTQMCHRVNPVIDLVVKDIKIPIKVMIRAKTDQIEAKLILSMAV